MQVSIETLEGLERKMTVQIPSDTVTQAIQKKLQELSKTVRIDGFRPGKVPIKVVQQKYGGHVRQEVIGDFIESSYQEAIQQEAVKPAGMPTIDSITSEEKEDMSYTAVFEVYPEVENLELEKINIEKLMVEVTDSDFEAMLEKLREQRKDWIDVDRPAKKGDQVMADFEGRIDGELFEGGAGKDMAIELGAGKMLPEFEDGLEGMSRDEEKTVVVNFPEDYQGKEVAGKKAEFTLKATKVSEPVLPVIDEEFAKAFGIEDGDIKKLHTDVRANMNKELQARVKQNTKKAVMEGLLEANEIIAPSALVEEESKVLKKQAIQRMGQGQDMASFDESKLPDDLFKKEASKRVQLGLLVGEVIRKENIKLDTSLVDAALEEMAASYEQPEQVMDYYRQNREARASLESMVLEDQVVTYILEKANVTEKQSNFEELMGDTV